MPRPLRSFFIRFGDFAAITAAVCLSAFAAACTPSPAPILPILGDMKPPSILEAGPESSEAFLVGFDEEIRTVRDSCYLEPGPLPLEARAEGRSLRMIFPDPLSAGGSYRIGGEAEDLSGNATRFLFSFAGWNDRPAPLVLNEIQPGKNSSRISPHRDYTEFLAIGDGDLGGLVFEWSSSVKTMEYRFPPCAVKAGEVIVLHHAPEGLAAEKDETGADLALSGGIDSSSAGRDLWTSAGPLPDENACLVVRPRPGAAPVDGLFYADADKSGPIGAGNLAEPLGELASAGLWELAGDPAWPDAFMWNPSSSRPLHRARNAAADKSAWSVGEPGTQSPGYVSPAVVSAGRGVLASKKKPRRKIRPGL